MRKQSGFTLIELMIVIAIIGILAAVAIPAYQDYIARAQASEAISLMSGMKVTATEYNTDKGVFPSDPTNIGGTTTGKYVASIAFTTTSLPNTLRMTATFNAANVNSNIASKTLVLRTQDGGKTWECTAGTIPAKYLPGGCK
ncbi:MAG: pilin [Magnetococcales bacterium]|nr:pilin [Magnetococcales bacterium]